MAKVAPNSAEQPACAEEPVRQISGKVAAGRAVQIVYLQDPRLLEWVERKLGVSFDARMCRWIAGVDMHHCVVWCVVYSRFSERSCQLTIGTNLRRTWANRRALRAIFGTPFLSWGLRRVTFVCAADNTRSIDLCRRLGAVEEGRLREAFDEGVDGVILGMLCEEAARWIAPLQGGNSLCSSLGLKRFRAPVLNECATERAHA